MGHVCHGEAPISVEAARHLYERGGGGHDFDHVLRVLNLALRIGEAEGADLTVVRTAALLHDVAESQDRETHHLIGAQTARELLSAEPAGFVEAVAHAIASHRFRADPAPRTLEARVLSDADKLDAIGAIGIGRAFAYAGAHGSALWRGSWRTLDEGATDDAAKSRPAVLGEGYTPVHEFVYKLARIPERLYTPAARAIAAERGAFMQEFFDRLDREVNGDV